MKRVGLLMVVALAAFGGCGDDADTTGAGGSSASSSSTGGASTTSGAGGSSSSSSSGSGGAPQVFGGDRPVTLAVPETYDGTPVPLLVSLHGYSGSGAIHEAYFKLRPAALARGMLVAIPDGTVDGNGNQFWNANAACCDFGGTGVDDSGYLRGVIEEIQAAYAVDPKRVYFVGHSNGHFMSYRMACDHADLVAAVAGLAGGMLSDGMGCTPSEPVHQLHVHGTMDQVVPHAGGPFTTTSIASAEDVVAFWAEQAGCAATPTTAETLDLVVDLPGAETQVLRHEGCTAGGSAEHWRIEGGSHIPSFGPDWSERLLDFLVAHSKT